MKVLSHCPTCSEKLIVKTLSCSKCGLEVSNTFELSPFDYLSSEDASFLMSFLRSRGNLKTVQEELSISYPTAKKRLEQILSSLGLTSKNEMEEMNMSRFEVAHGTNASSIIRNKLIESNGKATAYSYSGIPYDIYLSGDGKSFTCEARPIPFEFKVFDDIVEMLKKEGGKAAKGMARGYEVGSDKLNEHTVAGIIAIAYFGKCAGETALDPQAVLNAILAWADIASNERGYIKLTENYKRLVNYHA